MRPRLKLNLQRLIARGRPVEIRVDEHELARHTLLERLDAACPVERAMLEFGVSYEELPFTPEEERRLVLDEPAADVEAVLLILLFAFRRRETRCARSSRCCAARSLTPVRMGPMPGCVMTSTKNESAL